MSCKVHVKEFKEENILQIEKLEEGKCAWPPLSPLPAAMLQMSLFTGSDHLCINAPLS